MLTLPGGAAGKSRAPRTLRAPGQKLSIIPCQTGGQSIIQGLALYPSPLLAPSLQTENYIWALSVQFNENISVRRKVYYELSWQVFDVINVFAARYLLIRSHA